MITLKAIVEIPKGSYYKYERDKETGQLILDRTIQLAYPANYGYVEGTLAGDGDPLDIFILSEHPIPPLTVVTVDVFAAVKCSDNGAVDDKLLARISGDGYPGVLADIPWFLSFYKEGFKVGEFMNMEEVGILLEQSRRGYEQ